MNPPELQAIAEKEYPYADASHFTRRDYSQNTKNDVDLQRAAFIAGLQWGKSKLDLVALGKKFDEILTQESVDQWVKEHPELCKPDTSQLSAMEQGEGMRWVKSNDRRPDIEGEYYAKDSMGEKCISFFYGGHWKSVTGNPIVEWLDESPSDGQDWISVRETVARLVELKPYHIMPYNLGEMAEIGQLIGELQKLVLPKPPLQ